MKFLPPSTPVFYRSPKGYRMTGIVADYLPLRTCALKERGKETLIPIVKRRGDRVVWMQRSKLRKKAEPKVMAVDIAL